MTRAMDPETHYRNADRYRRLANKKQGVMEEIDAIEEGIKQIVRKLDPTIKSRLRRKADKLDDLGDETRKDLEYMDMDVRDVMTRAMDPETYYRNADRYRKLANKKQGVMEEIDAIEEGIKQIVRKLDPTIKSRLRRKADKLDDLGDETGQDLKYMDMEPQDVMTRAMDPETHYRNADRYRRLANKKQGVEEGSNAAKPDFLDLDKDGNKKESMKKAQQDLASKKKVDESVSVNISASDADAFGVIMKLAGLPVIGASQDSVAPETTSMGACMEARDDETPYDNKPDEKYSSIRDVTRAGKDLNRPKSQHADKAKLGDNPLATDLTESLWQAYEDLKKKI
jgi:Skp family chaperone for outer membrane proteins